MPRASEKGVPRGAGAPVGSGFPGTTVRRTTRGHAAHCRLSVVWVLAHGDATLSGVLRLVVVVFGINLDLSDAVAFVDLPDLHRLRLAVRLHVFEVFRCFDAHTERVKRTPLSCVGVGRVPRFVHASSVRVAGVTHERDLSVC